MRTKKLEIIANRDKKSETSDFNFVAKSPVETKQINEQEFSQYMDGALNGTLAN